jgi:hypothetical protein
MGVNYNDSRLTQVEKDKQKALSNVDETYGKMIENSDQYYDNLIKQQEQNAQIQSEQQQAQTDFAISQIEQQKQQSEKDYIKEQSSAYVDWKKQSNEYGAEAEKMAASGLSRSGYSETSQVNMYNTYQNRLSAASDAYNQIVQNYNNSITSARLQNDAILAEIMANSQEKQLQLMLEQFEYKNALILQREETKMTWDNVFHTRYLEVLDQIMAEAELAERQRQYNLNHELAQREFEYQKQMDRYQMEQARQESQGLLWGSPDPLDVVNYAINAVNSVKNSVGRKDEKDGGFFNGFF